MKALNIQNMKRAKQAGFTIIELVVVILLLGILTATALPRFLDISDDAHGAVVDAVEGSLRSGIALYRAGYVADGQNIDAALASFGAGTLFPNDDGSGFPVDAVDGDVAAGEGQVACLAVFNGLLDLGGLSVNSAAGPNVDQASENLIEAAAVGNDFVVTPNAAPAAIPTGCIFHYTGQFQAGTSTANQTIRTLSYAFATGVITEGTDTFDEDT